MKTRFYLLIALCILPICSQAQVQKLLDPNPDTTSLSSDLRELTLYKDVLYAYAKSEDQYGLWRMDTSSNKMELIVPGLDIRAMAATDSLLFFIAYTEENGLALWKSDGSKPKTELVNGVPPGTLYDLYANRNYAFFSISGVSGPFALWASDGTPTGTQFLSQFSRNGFSGFIGEIAMVEDKIFFIGIKNFTTQTIVESDGTTAGTIERHVSPNNRVSNIQSQDSLVYFLDRENSGNFLWQLRKDTVMKLHQVPSITFNSFGYRYKVHAFKGRHYFLGGKLEITPIDSLFFLSTDGGFGNLDTSYTFPFIRQLLAFYTLPHKLLVCTLGPTNKPELWAYDENGFAPSSIPLPDAHFAGQETMLLDSVLIFQTSNFEIMRTDGSMNGTYKISRLQWKRGFDYKPDAVVLGDRYYVSAGPKLFDHELYQTNGNTIDLFEDINPTPEGASIRNLHLVNNSLVFSAYSDTFGNEVWYSQGNPASSALLKDILPDQGTIPGWVYSSYPASFTPAEDELYFSARDSSSNHTSLFKTDGTPTGTQKVTDLWTSGEARSDFALTDHFYWKNKLYFSGAEQIRGLVPNAELYQYDPQLDSAYILKEIDSISTGSFPQRFTPTDDKLFFLAKTYNEGQELWITDGTSRGTKMVVEIEPGPGGAFQSSSSIYSVDLASLDSIIIFKANKRSSGWQIWRSNGTAAGTFVLQDSLGERRSSSLHKLGDQVLFFDNNPFSGIKLWATDGSESGTHLLLDQIPYGPTFEPKFLYTDDQVGFFTLRDDSLGVELWKTDGTNAGTQLLKDLLPGSASSYPDHMVAIMNGYYAFWAADSSGDRVLWISDGTSLGTQPDIYYRNGGSDLFNESQSLFEGNFLYFVAEDVHSGQALFRYDFVISGLDEKFDQNLSFEIYPNPAQTQIIVRKKEGLFNHSPRVVLMNLQAQVIQEFEISQRGVEQYVLQLSPNIIPGYYILAIESGDKTEFLKLIKQ